MDQEQNKFEQNLAEQSSDELEKEVESTPVESDSPQNAEPTAAVAEDACNSAQTTDTPMEQIPAAAPMLPVLKEEASASSEPSAAEEPSEGKQKHKKEKKAKKVKKEKKAKKERRPRKKHYVLRVFGALLRFILTLLLGMAIAYGSVVGIFYYAFSGLTIDVLQKFGIAENADEYLTSNGEIDLTSTSILELVADLNAVRADLANHTLDSLIKHYGISLPEETLEKLPTDLFSLPLDQLMSEDAGTVIAENLKFGYILSLLPPEMLSPLLIETLADRPLALLTSGAYGELFSGVKLGYLTGVTFDANGDVTYVDAENPTLQEVMATLDLGRVLEAATQNGDLLGVFATDIGTQEIRPLLGGIISGALLEKMCEGLYIKDVILPDGQTGRYHFDLNALTSALHLGDVLGYTYVNGTWYQEYTDNGDAADDVAATKMNAVLADIALSDVLGGTLSLDESFEDVYFGDLQSGYTRGDAITEPLPDSEELVVVGYQWLKDGSVLGKMQQELANIAITDLLNGKMDINKTLGSLYLGDMQGYTYREITDADTGAVIGHKWVKITAGVEEEISPVLAAIADVSVSAILNGELDLVGAMGDLTLGDVQSYTLGNDGRWYREVVVGTEITLQYVGAVQNSIADVPLADIMNGEFSLTGVFAELRMGDAMGYERGDVSVPADPDDASSYDQYAFFEKDGTTGTLTPVSGTMLELANLPLSDVLDGKVNFEDTVRNMTLAEALDYTEHDGVWYSAYTDDGDPANDVAVTGVLAVLADKRINELNSQTLDVIAFGEVLGYTHEDTDENGTPDTWYNGEEPAVGITASLADLTLGNLSDGDALAAKLREISLADAMGYQLVDGTWYSAYSDDGDDSNDTKLTGVLKVLADKPLNEIDSATIEGIALGDAIGYIYTDTNGDGTPDAWYNGDEPATGIMAKMADLTVAQLRNSSAVADKLGEVQLFEVLNYKKVEGQWQNSNGQPVSGVMSYLMETTVGDIEGKINEMPLGYAFGFYCDANTGKWYKDKEMTTEPAGITASLAGIHLGNAQAELEDMQIGDLLGYTYKDTDDDGEGDTWYEKEKPVTGLNLVLADLPISDLGNSDKVAAAMQQAKLGESLGFKNVEGKWYKTKTDSAGNTVADMDAPVTGLIGALADTKIGGLESDVKTVKIGTMLELTEEDGVWYDGNGTAVKGAVSVLAKSDLSTLSDNINNMTVADLWNDSERTGILKAISGDTKISELDKAIQECTVDALVTAGVLEVGTAQALFFDVKMPGWRTYNVVDFINGMLKLDVFSLVP
ncbi:MAG: hypothetical protein IKA06_05065 [Clostridia bacterium]|nr:hypothetical protein [Clostridia bacterium]